jgi:tetratricopeptide (TPR) repeat protein
MRGFLFLSFALALFAGSPEFDRAYELYQRTDYKQSLAVLTAIPEARRDAEALQLIGQNYWMMGEYKKASDTFEKAVVLAPQDSELHHWLGRAHCRRAETGSFLTAPSSAAKCRQSFERSVQLDPNNHEAVNDLFDYYLQAPGFLGGGIDKAEKLAQHIAKLDDAEGHYAQAQLDDKRKEYGKAEEHLRRAAELAPRQVGRVLDLAKYLANRGRMKESDAMFQEAAKIAPGNAKVLFDRAEAYIRQRRNLADARQMLEQYLKAPLTPDDPPRERAQELLKQIGH